ncbi:hypothetical protein FA95DRAFT_1563179, partial [Auriscalpium vulgare]
MSSLVAAPFSRQASQTDAQAFWYATTQGRSANLQLQESCGPSLRPSAVAEQVIDGELEALYAAARFLNSQRNTLVAKTSILPPEVLSRIFQFLAVVHRYDPERRTARLGRSCKSLGWIVVTHVCRCWRQVVVDDPSFWCTLSPGMSRKWNAETIARSMDYPMSVEINDDSWLSMDISPFPPFERSQPSILAPLLPRIKDLSIRVEATPLEAFLPDLMAFSAPMMETLTLHVPNRYRHDRTPVLTDLFAGKTSLRTISLSGVSFSWSCFPAGRLTHLTLTGVSDAPPVVGSWVQFLEILEQSPMLEVLALTNCFPPRERPAAVARRVAEFPHMTKVDLSGHPSDAVNIMSHIVTPTSTCCYLQCNGSIPEYDAFATLAISLFQAKALASIRTFAIRFEKDSLQLLLFLDRYDLDGLTTPTTPSLMDPVLALHWDGDVSHTLLISLLQRVAEEIRAEDVQTLLLEGGRNYCFKASPWLDIFCRFTEVENLWIRSRAEPSFLSTLAMSNPSAAFHASGSIAPQPEPLFRSSMSFPRLHSLCLDVDGSGLAFQPLLAAVEGRRSHGASLTRLVLSGCSSLDPTQVKMLHPLVQILEGWRRVSGRHHRETVSSLGRDLPSSWATLVAAAKRDRTSQRTTYSDYRRFGFWWPPRYEKFVYDLNHAQDTDRYFPVDDSERYRYLYDLEKNPDGRYPPESIALMYIS